MGEFDIIEWFDDVWPRARDRALQQGWGSLSRPDQVLVAVGFLVDSCVGDGVWAIVDGLLEGNDEGLTVYMPDALEAIGMPWAGEHIRQIILLRSMRGSPIDEQTNRAKALEHWRAIREIFDEWVPGGERVIVTRLFEWHLAQPA